ncbi:hypothetical protein HDU80_004879 [Chytriomyces hyalinus]|nr:hypothetical protein HDU80_004879 [Chytriomyces hyalinus]
MSEAAETLFQAAGTCEGAIALNSRSGEVVATRGTLTGATDVAQPLYGIVMDAMRFSGKETLDSVTVLIDGGKRELVATADSELIIAILRVVH